MMEVLDGRSLAPALLDGIAEHLDAGGLLVYPTETVYGLGGSVRVAHAVAALKGRERENPFLVLLPLPTARESSGARAGGPAVDRDDIEGALRSHGLDPSREALSVASALWPGPVTLVISDEAGSFPAGVRSSSGGVAVRASSHPFVRALQMGWPHPLVSTSANVTGEPPAASVADLVERWRGRPQADRLWIVDAGPLPTSPPSTVVDCRTPRPRLVRAGAVSLERLREIVPGIEEP